MRAVIKLFLLVFLSLFVVPLAARAAWFLFEDRPTSWRTANWSSVGMLPKAADHQDARILVLSGRTGGLKGLFAVHSWVVVKREGADRWSRYDVVGWGNPVRLNGWAADARWYGDAPMIVADLKGAAAAAVIPKIERAVTQYRHARAGDYRIWPGPNSNTFIAAVLRAVPELNATLPPHAVGKDFRDEGFYAGLTDSGTGVEFNLWGIAGFKIGWIEGVELNLFTLVTGFDLRQPALKLPGFGRIGVGLPVAVASAKSGG
jgi:hypothetical protein